MTFLQTHATAERTQREQSDPRQVANAAGGFVFPIDGWQQLNRWLILGSQGGTFYTSEKDHTEKNLDVVRACIEVDGLRVVQACFDVSTQGLAAKQEYALYVLAMCIASKDLETRKAAFAAMSAIARTGATFFLLLSYLRGLRSSAAVNAKGQLPALFTGNGLKRAVARWFNNKNVDRLAYQMVKYRQRYGIEMRDALRLAHPSPYDGTEIEAVGETPTINTQRTSRAALYRWGAQKDVTFTDVAGKISTSVADLPRAVTDFQVAQSLGEFDPTNEPFGKRATELAARLPREALPTSWLNDPKVWEALLYGASSDPEEASTVTPGMPIGALIRNLGKLSAVKLLVPGSDAERYVCGELRNESRLRAARVHPIALYLASKIYAQGHGDQGKLVWAPSRAVVDALEDGFGLAFQNVVPTYLEQLVAIDVSGSMVTHSVCGYSNISSAEMAMIFAFVLAKTEPKAHVIAFSDSAHGVQEYPIASNETLRDFVHRIKDGGGTDLSMPMKWARNTGRVFEAITILTDNETWAGKRHVYQEIELLRRTQQRKTRIVTIAAAATGTQVTDPRDKFSFGVAGFSSDVPALVRSFIVGKF